MFSVTQKASEMIAEFFKGRQEARSLRVMLQGGGCSGYSLGLAMDGSKPDDEVFEQDGVNYVIESGGLFISLPEAGAWELLATMKNAGITDAAIIGEVVSAPPGKFIVE